MTLGPYVVVQSIPSTPRDAYSCDLVFDRSAPVTAQSVGLLRRVKPSATLRDHERFLEACALARRFSHPNLLSGHPVVLAGGPALFQPNAAGHVLADVIEPSTYGRRIPPFSVSTACLIIDQVAAALSYVHSQGYVLRDIWPGNILISFDGGVRLAHTLYAQPAHSGTFYDGRWPYASDVLKYFPPTPQTDVYSLSVVLWETLTGDTFCPGSSFSWPRRPSALNPRIPSELEAVTMRALCFKDTLANDLRSSLAPFLASDEDLRGRLERPPFNAARIRELQARLAALAGRPLPS